MRDPEEQPRKESKRAAAEAERLVKEQTRKKAYLAREQAIEKVWKAEGAKRAEKRATEEPAQLARDQERKKALLAREQAIAEAQQARKLKEKKQPPPTVQKGAK